MAVCAENRGAVTAAPDHRQRWECRPSRRGAGRAAEAEGPRPPADLVAKAGAAGSGGRSLASTTCGRMRSSGWPRRAACSTGPTVSGPSRTLAGAGSREAEPASGRVAAVRLELRRSVAALMIPDPMRRLVRYRRGRGLLVRPGPAERRAPVGSRSSRTA